MNVNENRGEDISKGRPYQARPAQEFRLSQSPDDTFYEKSGCTHPALPEECPCHLYYASEWYEPTEGNEICKEMQETETK